MAYRSFRFSKIEARGVRKVTTGITGLWQPSVHSDALTSLSPLAVCCAPQLTPSLIPSSEYPNHHCKSSVRFYHRIPPLPQTWFPFACAEHGFHSHAPIAATSICFPQSYTGVALISHLAVLRWISYTGVVYTTRRLLSRHLSLIKSTQGLF